LLSVADDDLRLRILLALGYGLRAAEIYNLKRTDVNYASCQISVHRLKKRRRVATILTLPGHLLDMLKLVAENNHKRHDHVFAHETCSGRFRQALMKADIDPTVRFHDLRHTAASWLLSNGLNLEQIRIFLGHGDIATTQRYLHVADKEVAEAGQELLRRLM
jgi:integrase